MTMPMFLWIEIGVIVGIAAVVFLYLIWKRGIKGKAKSVSFVINGTGMEAPPAMSRALLHLERSVPAMYDILYTKFLGMMEDVGVQKEYLGSYDDSLYMRMLLRYAVSGGNGSNSTQKILEQVVVDGEYKRNGDNIEAYVRVHVWPRILRSLKNFIDSDYHSDVHDGTGNVRTRRVDATSYIIAISKEPVSEELIKSIVSILSYAKNCVENGCEN